MLKPDIKGGADGVNQTFTYLLLNIKLDSTPFIQKIDRYVQNEQQSAPAKPVQFSGSYYMDKVQEVLSAWNS